MHMQAVTNLQLFKVVLEDVLHPRDEDTISQDQFSLVELGTATVGHHSRNVENGLRCHVSVVERYFT